MSHDPLPNRMYWNALGYHAFPVTEQDRVDSPADFPAWQAYSNVLERAKQGDFDHIRLLLDWHAQSDDWVLRRAYVKLLGDAGIAAVLRDLKEKFSDAPLSFQFDYGESLINWGSLSVVPMLLDLYAANHEYEDAKFIPNRLSRLLEEEPGPIHAFPRKGPVEAVASYCRLVMDRYEELARVLGSDKTIVFRGEGLHIVVVAERILQDLERQQFDAEMRHKFEAMTGIDCRGFYQDGALQPLAAAAIVEEFLEGAEAARYEEGVRYFFGHRVPDSTPA